MMLSAAHALAMDAKNLLDVVDSIRIRYPEINDKLTAFFSESILQEIAHPEAAAVVDEVTVNRPPTNSPQITKPSFQPTMSAAASACVVNRTQVEQPIYNFATSVPPSLNSHASISKPS